MRSHPANECIQMSTGQAEQCPSCLTTNPCKRGNMQSKACLWHAACALKTINSTLQIKSGLGGMSSSQYAPAYML